MMLIVVIPLFAGLLAKRYSFNDAQLGFFASGDMAGMVAGSLATAVAIRHFRWEALAIAGACVLAMGNVLSSLSPSFFSLIAFRVLSGFGGGALTGVCFAIFAATRDPERPFAIYAALQTLFAAFAFLVLPSVMRRFGPSGAFLALALASIPAIAAASQLRRPASVAATTAILGRALRSVTNDRMLRAGVTSVLAYFAAQGAVWAFVERFGSQAGLSDDTISVALSISQFPAVLGSGLVAVAGRRFGRVGPILAAFALVLCAVIALFHPTGALLYGTVIGAFLFGWNVFISYQAAVLSDADATKVVMPLVAAATFGGLALGPFVAGALANRYGLPLVLVFGVMLNFVALSCLIPLLLRQRIAAVSTTAPRSRSSI